MADVTPMNVLDPALVERAQTAVLSRVAIVDAGHSSPCWVSDRARHTNGYTKTGLRGTTWLTHRLAYEAFVGPIGNLQLDHLCRNRACCNPNHLEPVTCRTNLLRGVTLTASEAARTHCPAGHEYTPENTYRRPDRTGRMCRACGRDGARRRRSSR